MSAAHDLARRWWQGDLGAGGTMLDVLLAPAEATYRVAIGIRNQAYQSGVLRTERAPIPVISVGNVAVGGTGKTPFAHYIAITLRERGARPAVLHGGYGDDEPALHRHWSPDIPVVVDRDRVRGARSAAAAGCNVVILDDGFQHRRLARDLDLVLVSAERWSHRTRLLPRGPWREPPESLRRADIIVCTRKTASADEAERARVTLAAATERAIVNVHLRADTWLHDGVLSPPPADGALLVAALAEPTLFEANATAAGAAITNRLIFPDHHAYTSADAARIVRAANGGRIVTTEKDWMKLAVQLANADVWVLRQSVVVEQGSDALNAALDRVVA